MIKLYSLFVSLRPESRSVKYNELSCFLKFVFMESMLSYGCMSGGFTDGKLNKWLMYSKHHWCSNWTTLGVEFVLAGNNSVIMH